MTETAAASPKTIRRWQRYLADERAEGALYRHLAQRRSGQEREILLQLADAELRHETHWKDLLGTDAEQVGKASWRTRGLVWLAKYFGSVFVLALAQRAEHRSPYAADEHATETMAADERVHGEVVRSLAEHRRNKLSGGFRAAIFGANDGLVSNLALVLGIGAAGASTKMVLLAGLAGLLAGALSMGAGEYVSVRSQRELVDASLPDPQVNAALMHLDVEANELALVYRARGMEADQAASHAEEVLAGLQPWIADHPDGSDDDRHEVLGTATKAAVLSFLLFSSGAIVPVLPYAFGLTGFSAQVWAGALVGVALLITGAIVGLISGGPPIRRALRQLAIGYCAAAATYILGYLVGI